MSRAARCLLGAVVLWGACLAGACWAQPRRTSEWIRQSRPRNYDPATDTFRKQSIVSAAQPTQRPGGELIYYGDRRQQFQFRGPAGRGGLYDALRQYKESLPLDPNNYRYRWRR